MPHARSAFTLALVALLLAPGAAGLMVDAGAAPATEPAPLPPVLPGGPLDVLRLVGERAAPVDQGALRDLVALHVAPGGAPLLRVAAATATPTADDAGTPLPQPQNGEHVWVNDSHVTATRLGISWGAVLTLRNSTLTILPDEDGWAGYVSVSPQAALVLENSTLRGVAVDRDRARIYIGGTLDAYGSTFDSVETYLSPYGETADLALVERSSFVGVGATFVDRNATVRESLFWNKTDAALKAGENAVVTGNTLVNNEIGISLDGPGAVVTGNTLRFNRVGATWTGAENVTFRGNNLRDNYQDALYSSAVGASATLDAGGNWWDGVPNVDGDSWGGPGVSVSSYASAPFDVPDRSDELPFRLNSMRGNVAWPAGRAVDGPVIARGGTLSFGAGVVEANGFPIGSHVGARLQVAGTEFRNPQLLFSRADDSFTSMTVVSGSGVLALGGSPTIRDSRFVNVSSGVLASVRALGDAPVSLLVEGTRFEGSTAGVFALLASTTLRGNTFTDAPVGLAFVTALCPSVVVERNLVTDSGGGIVDILSQTFTASGNSVYNSAIGALLGLTASPSVRDHEGRFNMLDVFVLGSQVTLVTSNLYDDPVYGVYVADLHYPDPQTGANVTAQGRVAIDPTTYVGAPTAGNVSFLPPRKAAPSATPGRAATYAPTLVGAGQTLRITGDATLAGPLIVRQGGSLRLDGATLDPGKFLVGAMPGTSVLVQNSTVAGGSALVVHADDARIENSTFDGQGFGVYLVESQRSSVHQSRFLDGPLGLALWDSTTRVSRSLFTTQTGVQITNETWPRRGDPLVEESVFTGATAVLGAGHPVGTLRNNTFDSPVAIDNTRLATRAPADGRAGSGILDARGNWFGAETGPRVPGDWWAPGNEIHWPKEGSNVLYDPWRTTPFRASFDAPPAVVTDVQPIAFRDTSFDLDGGISGRLWDFGDGGTDTAMHPVHVFARHGPATVRLEVTDTLGRVSNATADVLVKAVPRAVATGPASVLSLVEAEFDASASFDPDGSVAAYRFVASDGADTGFTASPAFRHAFPRPGLHTVTVTTRDDEGFVGPAALVEVLVLNREPTVGFAATPASPTRADVVTLASTSLDLDGSIVDWTWDLGDGATVLHGPTVQHRFPNISTYAVRLTVTDDQGATNVTVQQLAVANAPPVPAFSATPARPKPGVEVAFESASYDPDGVLLEHAWDFGDGTTGTGPLAAHAYADEGDYVVTLAVTDADGTISTLSRILAVRWNLPPAAAFDVSTLGDAAPHEFFDRSRDEDGTVVAWRWDFGDGGASTERNPRHRYLDAGHMRVTLTVTDDKGAEDTTTRLLAVDDVLVVTAAARPRPPGLDAPLVLDVRTAWANASAVPAGFVVDVYHAPEGTAPHQWRHYARVTGATGPDGAAEAKVPPLAAGKTLPGRYHVIVQADTRLGFGGNLERAAQASFVTVSAL